MSIQPEIVEFNQVVDTDTFINWVKNRTLNTEFLIKFGRELRILYDMLGTVHATTSLAMESLELYCGSESCDFAHPVKIVKMFLSDIDKPDNQAAAEWCFILNREHDIIGFDEPSLFPQVKELLEARGTVIDRSPNRILH